MASEVTSDLNCELSGLSNLHVPVLLWPLYGLKSLLFPGGGGGRQNGLVDLRARTSPQIKRGWEGAKIQTYI